MGGRGAATWGRPQLKGAPRCRGSRWPQGKGGPAGQAARLCAPTGSAPRRRTWRIWRENFSSSSGKGACQGAKEQAKRAPPGLRDVPRAPRAPSAPEEASVARRGGTRAGPEPAQPAPPRLRQPPGSGQRCSRWQRPRAPRPPPSLAARPWLEALSTGVSAAPTPSPGPAGPQPRPRGTRKLRGEDAGRCKLRTGPTGAS